MGSCQNYGPFLGTLNIRCCIIIGVQKGNRIMTTIHIGFGVSGSGSRVWDLEFKIGDKGIDWDYIGVMEKKIETTTLYRV